MCIMSLMVFAQGLANCLWSVATLGLEPDESWLCGVLDNQQHLATLVTAETLEPQHVSNSMWAIAKIGFYPGEQHVHLSA